MLLKNFLTLPIMSTSSSSSEDENLAKFASVAVSAEQIHTQSRVDAQKRAVQATRRPISSGPNSCSRPADAATAAAHGTPQQHDEDQVTGLDLVSVKIAAALDAILAKQLGNTDSMSPPTTAAAAGPHSTPQSPAIAAAASTGPTQAPASADAAAAGGASDADDGTGVQLFRTVPKGTPCILPQSSRADAWEPLAQAHQHHHQAAGAGGAFGSASLPRTQPLRDQIPRLSLAEASRQGSKRKHEAIMAELTVDGKALQAAAAAAGYANRAVPGSGSSTGAAGHGGGKVINTAGWVKCWRRLKGQKAPGVVVEAKPWVPYEERAAKLLGTPSVPAA